MHYECRVPSAETQSRHSALSTRHFLLPDSELVDDGAIPLLIGLLEVIEKAATAPNELEQSPPAVVIFRVGLEMLCQVGDSVREEGNLHFRRAGVTIVGSVMRNQIRFLLLGGW